MSLAPIILFVYKRPKQTQQVLKALAANNLANESILYVFCDGPKENINKKDIKDIARTRAIVKSKKWCKEVHIIERIQNIGLSFSIINGVKEITQKHGKAIILEDDIVSSKFFLQYMNDALDLYEKEEKVLSIGALNFFANDDEVAETFFIKIPDCWGWATWRNRWDLFEPDGKKLLKQLREKNLIDAFNLNGAFDYEQLLLYQIEGKVDSWAIRWQAVAYVQDKLSLYPKYSVTKNIGNNYNAGATHNGEDVFSNLVKFCEEKINLNPIEISQEREVKEKLIECFRNIQNRKPQITPIQNLKSLIKKTVPPALYSLLKKIKNNPPNAHSLKFWTGVYPDWKSAKDQSTQYSTPEILKQVVFATKLVNEGIYAYERDSVLFREIQFNWALLASLQKISLENNHELYVLDFGGSLGSTYRQNKQWFTHLKNFKWIVVEQEHFVNAGKKEFEDEHLKFEFTCEDALAKYPINCILLSCVIQYLENPIYWLSKFNNYRISNIITDRLGEIDSSGNVITKQNVPSGIYDASYPVWFFEQSFVPRQLNNYQFIAQFDSFCDGDYQHEAGYCKWKGYHFKLKSA